MSRERDRAVTDVDREPSLSRLVGDTAERRSERAEIANLCCHGLVPDWNTQSVIGQRDLQADVIPGVYAGHIFPAPILEFSCQRKG